jgi:mono/diheme cytochrome c family protein
MTGRLSTAVPVFAGIVSLIGAAAALAQQPSPEIDFGRREFVLSCAVCHGVSGKGDGIYRELLTKSPADLTILSKDNKGVFPYRKIYDIIDGREEVKAHGPRDMPIWGALYRKEGNADFLTAPLYGTNVPYDPEIYVRIRITTLIEYLQRLQGK